MAIALFFLIDISSQIMTSKNERREDVLLIFNNHHFSFFLATPSHIFCLPTIICSPLFILTT
uniref:Putative ovule protein n=1 Tax=Solanum chacoense TaxID=4108 RepID=A0A0V0GFX9_SOLCH